MSILWGTYQTEPLSKSSSAATIVVALTQRDVMYELSGEPRAQLNILSPDTLSTISMRAVTKGFGLWGDEVTPAAKQKRQYNPAFSS